MLYEVITDRLAQGERVVLAGSTSGHSAWNRGARMKTPSTGPPSAGASTAASNESTWRP